MSDSRPGEPPEDVEAAPVLPPGTRLGKYELGRALGAGGMGAVYEATHTDIGKRVAIKVLNPGIAAIPGARARFLREAQLTSKIRHPNIVDVADMGNDAGQTYIVMELLSGEDLAQRLSRGPLSAAELADVILPVCAAVAAAHRAGVTHRDLKPQNIFLSQGPHGVQPKVLDFGISKGSDTISAGTLTGTGSIIGTPFYLAPEQILDSRVAGPGTDQYALGVIMYECLVGRRAYDGETLYVVFQAIVNGGAPPLQMQRPDLPPGMEAVVTRAMNVDPKRRFPSTNALGRALLPFASTRQRSIWEDRFDASAEPDLVPPPRVMAATTPMPKPPVAGTQILPPEMTPQPPPLRTSGAARAGGATTGNRWAADSFIAEPPARSGRGKMIAGLAMLVVAAGVGIFATRGSDQRASQQPAPRPAVELPPTADPPPPPPPAAVVMPPPAATTRAADVAPGPSPSSSSSRPVARPTSHGHSKPPAPKPASAPRVLNPNDAPVVD